MDTLQKLAGVQQIGESIPSSRPAAFPDPPPIPEDDPHSLAHKGSRVSLPLNRQASRKSINSASALEKPSRENIHGDAPAAPIRASADTGHSGASEDDFPWGPSHPCFPHPNPHCSPDSEEHRQTRVIRVRRDWFNSGDLYPQYANLYPEILDPLVLDSDFRFLITNINNRIERAANPYTARAWLDAAMGVVTGFVWDDMGLTGVKHGVKGLEQFIDRWNAQKAGEGHDVRLVQLRKTGFMALDFVIPDPGIDAPPQGVPSETG